MSDFYCLVCHTPLPPDYDPQYCCPGASNECGCMGQPTNPPVCSDECWNALLKRNSSPQQRSGDE